MTMALARKRYVQTNHGPAGAALTSEADFNLMTDFHITWQKASADAASATVTTNTPVLVNAPYSFDVIAVTWMSVSAHSSVATQYTTFTLNRNLGAGSGSGSTMTAVAAKTTASTAVTARAEYPLTVSTVAGAKTVATGACLFLNIGKTGAGRKNGAGTLTIHCRKV